MYRCDGATGWAVRFSIPGKCKKFPLSKRQSGLAVDPTSLLCKVPEVILPGGEVNHSEEIEVDHLPQCKVDVKNKWNLILLSPHPYALWRGQGQLCLLWFLQKTTIAII